MQSTKIMRLDNLAYIVYGSTTEAHPLLFGKTEATPHRSKPSVIKNIGTMVGPR